MNRLRRAIAPLIIALVATVALAVPRPAIAADTAAINRDAQAALKTLYDTTPKAKMLGEKAKAVLVFPSILKAGLIIGGQGGNGALIFPVPPTMLPYSSSTPGWDTLTAVAFAASIELPPPRATRLSQPSLL